MTTFKTKYNRRSFLKVSAAAGGGLMIGFSTLLSCNPNEEDEEIVQKEPPSEWFDVNAYLKIGDNGLVSILSPNPEIGQNVKTSMPMIVAEELDVAWEDVVVEQGDLNTDWFKRQVAGGSQSIRQEWEALRMAGATAKAMLVSAAAAQWNVDAATITVENGIISNANGETLGYGDVASAAAQLEVPEEVTLKEPKDFKIIGTSRKNVDIKNIVTGEPLFGLDYKVEGMKYAVVQRPPSFGLKLKSFDDTEARKVKGVIDVVKIEVPLKEGYTLEKVAVVADNTWAALKGQKALKTEWDKGSDLENSADHDAKMNELLDTGKDANTRRKDGDLEKAFSEADEIVERTYEAPYLPHNCMEPMNFFAHVTEEKAELMGPIQTPAWTEQRTADFLGMDAEKITVGMTRMGGGFGRRLYGDFAMEAVAISKVTGLPIKVVYTREDDMMAGTYRPASKYRIKAAIKDGKITGYHLSEVCMSANMYGVLPNNFPAGAINNYQVDNYQVASNITIGAWRAPYTNFLASAEQSFFDEVATMLGEDPVQFRIAIFEDALKVYQQHEEAEKAGDEDAIKKAKEGLLPKGNYEPQRFIDVIKLAAEKSNWGNTPEGVHQGFSVYYSHNTYVAEVADMVMEGDKPVIKKVTCAVDCGIVVNPDAATNLVQGGVIDGIGHAMYGDFQFNNGQGTANNFDKYRLIRMPEAPPVEVYFVDNGIDPTGLGEPTLPPAGAAVANALFRATNERLYSQPYIKSSSVLG